MPKAGDKARAGNVTAVPQCSRFGVRCVLFEIEPRYDRPWGPWAFDVLSGAVFVPLGGVGRLRARALDLLDLRPGPGVLEPFIRRVRQAEQAGRLHS